MRDHKLDKKRARPLHLPFPRWIRGAAAGNLPVALVAFALLFAGAAPGCKKHSNTEPAPTAQKTSPPVARTVAGQPRPSAPPATTHAFIEGEWAEGNTRERVGSISGTPCEVGNPGCICLPSFRCSGGAECYWGFCYGEGFPTPKTYRYTHKSRTDYYVFRKLILSQLRLESTMKIADIGAGAGKYTFAIADRLGPESTIYATDIDPKAVGHLAKTVTARKDTHRDSAPVKPLLVNHVRDTGLDTLPDNHLDLILMINSVVFYRDESPEADNKYLMSLLGKLKPGGRMFYHVDWIQAHDGLSIQGAKAYFQKAGFSGEPRVIPMPKHIPDSTYYVKYSAGGSEQRMPLYRGFILEFMKGSPSRSSP